MDKYDNKKRQDLEKYESKCGRYVPFFLYSQKESNRPIDLGKK